MRKRGPPRLPQPLALEAFYKGTEKFNLKVPGRSAAFHEVATFYVGRYFCEIKLPNNHDTIKFTLFPVPLDAIQLIKRYIGIILETGAYDTLKRKDILKIKKHLNQTMILNCPIDQCKKKGKRGEILEHFLTFHLNSKVYCPVRPCLEDKCPFTFASLLSHCNLKHGVGIHADCGHGLIRVNLFFIRCSLTFRESSKLYITSEIFSGRG